MTLLGITLPKQLPANSHTFMIDHEVVRQQSEATSTFVAFLREYFGRCE